MGRAQRSWFVENPTRPRFTYQFESFANVVNGGTPGLATGTFPRSNAASSPVIGESTSSSQMLEFRGILGSNNAWEADWKSYEGCGGSSEKMLGDEVEIWVNLKNVFLTMAQDSTCGHPYLKFNEQNSIDALPDKGGDRFFWLRSDCPTLFQEWKEVNGVWQCA